MANLTKITSKSKATSTNAGGVFMPTDQKKMQEEEEQLLPAEHVQLTRARRESHVRLEI